MIVPHTELQTETLQALVEEYVSREGTDYGGPEFNLQQKVEQVLHQLEQGQAFIIYSELHESCSIISKDELERGQTDG